MNFIYPDDYTEINARENHPELLSWMIHQNKEDGIAHIVLQNPHTPSDALAYYLKNGKDYFLI